MGLQYRINVLSALKDAGYNTYVLKKRKLLSESTIQKLRDGEQVGWRNIESICRLLKCQPNDFLEFVPDEEESATPADESKLSEHVDDTEEDI